MNNITIELCKEDRERLDLLNASLARLSNVQEALASVPAVLSAISEQVEPAAAPEQPEPVEVPAPPTKPEPVAAPEPEKPQVKLADVQKKVVDLSTAGKKDAVKSVIQAYAPRVSAIPEDKLAEVFEKLTALEG